MFDYGCLKVRRKCINAHSLCIYMLRRDESGTQQILLSAMMDHTAFFTPCRGTAACEAPRVQLVMKASHGAAGAHRKNDPLMTLTMSGMGAECMGSFCERCECAMTRLRAPCDAAGLWRHYSLKFAVEAMYV